MIKLFCKSFQNVSADPVIPSTIARRIPARIGRSIPFTAMDVKISILMASDMLTTSAMN